MIAFGLPVGQGLVFPTDCAELPNPEYTGPFDILRYLVIENDGGLALIMVYVKCIRHDQKDVNIVGMGCGRDEGAEYREPSNLPGAGGQGVNPFQTLTDKASLQRCGAKMFKHLRQRRTLNSCRHIAIPVECGPFLHRDCPPFEIYLCA